MDPESTTDPDEGLDREDGPGLVGIEGDWDEFPCNALDQAAVDEIFGPGDRLPPQVNQVNVIENGDEFTGVECSWTALGDPAVTPDMPADGRVQVSLAGDFPDGQVSCPQLAGAVELHGVGDSAQWDWSDPGTRLTVGTLRVCTADAYLEARTSGTDGEAQLQTIAVAVAEAVLDSLP